MGDYSPSIVFMKYEEQLEKLESIILEIRILQESGLWEPLHDAKILIRKLHAEIEKEKEIYDKKTKGQV